MSPKIVLEESPGIYVSEVFPNLLQRSKNPQPVDGQSATAFEGKPIPAFNPTPLHDFLHVMNSSSLQGDSPNNVKRDA